MTDLIQDLEDRFLRYVRIDTQSDEFSNTVPSTTKQFDLLNLLVDELQAMGAADVKITDYAVVYATIPATAGCEQAPVVAFWAHVDTSPAFSGAGVRPIVHRRYDGRPLTLPGSPDLVLDPAQFPYLKEKIGEDIVTSDGTTLLGADDKAGVAILMSLGRYLLEHPDIPHDRIRLCFTPDEEIGQGVSHVRLEDVEANIAYTLDGGGRGEICFETFSADKAVVRIEGVAAHPGYAKDILVNALHLVGKFIERLPQDHRSPETTSERDGFIHVTEVRGTATAAEIYLILRDYEREGLRSHGEFVRQIADEVQALEPRARVTCTITKQYRNMRYWLETDMRPVELARQAVRDLGMEPFDAAARGGTDGSRLTEMGLPTPNLFTGMQNYHGPTEWISLQDMARSVEVCVRLAELWGRETA